MNRSAWISSFSVLFAWGTAFSGPVSAEQPASAQNSALTLEQCYEASLKRSEVIASQVELITQAEEHIRQAKGNLLPAVNAGASYFWQAAPSTLFGSTYSPSSQPLLKLSATQPIFHGMREYAALKQTKNLASAQRFATRQAEIQLYKDVAQAFYNTVSLERDLATIQRELGQYRKRIAELNARIRIGRSRVSEVLTVQSVMATLQSQAEQVRGQLQVSRETLAFLTGFEAGIALRDAEDLSLEPAQGGRVAEYLSAIERRPDVQADQERQNAAEDNVRVAEGAHLPTIDLSANYYLVRSGSLQNVSWDANLGISLPIFAGGVLQSKVREAASQLRAAEESLSRTRRLAVDEIRSTLETYIADYNQMMKLEEAVRLASKNYGEESREYRLGLVTNLDVLQALTSQTENLRAFDRARSSVKLDWARLQAAVAKRPERSIVEVE